MKTVCPKCHETIEVNLGRLAGSVKSEKKDLACRKNSKMGGWPKGVPRKVPCPKCKGKTKNGSGDITCQHCGTVFTYAEAINAL